MLRSLAAAAVLLCSACAWGASSRATDAQWEGYFNVWAKDATATPQAREQFYASRSNYYGHEMTPAEVYRDKLHLIRLWPMRSYHVAPGTVVTSCSQDHNRCAVTLVLDWQSANLTLGIGTQGATIVSLDLIRQGGQMKIGRESGVPLLRSTCKLAAPEGHKAAWQCSAYRFPPLPTNASG